MRPDHVLDIPESPGRTPPTRREPTASDTLRARFLFCLGFAHLLLVAGLVHRATSAGVTDLELDVIYAGLLALWPVFVAEAMWGVVRRDRAQPFAPVLLRAVLVCVLPPWRMALADPRTNLVWVPRLGWHAPGRDLFKRLQHAFAAPMVLFALLILPVLVLEYFAADLIKTTPGFGLALDIGIAVIWVAFATKFVFLASTHPRPFAFVQDHWLDVVVVVLPMLEFVLSSWVDAAPLARLLRLGRALSPEQIARLQRLYRLKGVATKGWQAVLLLEGLARLFGQTPQKRLARLEEKIAELEEELAEIRRDARALRESIAEEERRDAAAEGQNQPVATSGGGTGEPSGEVATATSRPSAP